MRSDIRSLDGCRFDVVVIGGGINGASTTQHLAAAGYRVLVVDKGDFGSGASSRSSRLLHCGLRYLAPGRSLFDFVRHPSRLKAALRMARLAMEARSEFVRTTPARTNAMRLYFPIYRGGPYRSWQVDLAFKILGLLGPKDVSLDYERLSPDEVRRLPLVNGLRDLDRLEAVAAFREYQFHWPERVGLDAIRDAERLGALARNYTRARLCSHQEGQGWTVELTDVIAAAAPVQVRAGVVLNMAGVWIDEILRETSPNVGRKVFGTKGCHIVVTLPASCLGAGIATLNSKDEPFYCVPWGRFHYFGPTETRYEGDQDRVFVTEDEMRWLIHEANRLLPGLKLTAADVRMTWAGVRPLTYDEAVPFGNRSRTIHDLSGDGLPDVFAMTAGPLMTHRSAGREMTRLVAQRMAPTGRLQLPDYAPPSSAEPDAEHSVTLSDFLFRRRGTAWFGPVSDADLERSAAELGAMLGWDEARVREEAEAFRAEWDSLFDRPGPRTSAERFTAPGVHGTPTELLPASRS